LDCFLHGRRLKHPKYIILLVKEGTLIEYFMLLWQQLYYGCVGFATPVDPIGEQLSVDPPQTLANAADDSFAASHHAPSGQLQLCKRPSSADTTAKLNSK